MSRRTIIAALAAVLVAAGCSDATGPPNEPPPAQEQSVPDGALQSLRWGELDGPIDFSIVALPDDEGPADGGDVLIARAPAAGPPRLDRYEVTFTAVKGRTRSIQINYRNGRGVRPFLRFSVPRNALYRRPDGSRIRWGESVLITVSVSHTKLRVDFEPSGLEFSRWSPPWLQVWYGGADWDFNGDGVVDEQDEEIQRRRLRLWIQDEAGGPWHRLPARHSVRHKWFAAPLPHFSGVQPSW
jgi:hypothetical protein